MPNARLLLVALLFSLPCARAGEPEEAPESPFSFEESSQPLDLLKQGKTAAEKGDLQAAATCLDRAAGQVEGKVAWAGDGLFLPAWRVVHRKTRQLPQPALDAYAKLAVDKALADARGAKDLAARTAVVRARFAILPAEEVLHIARDLAESGQAHAAEALLEELTLHSPPSAAVPEASLLLARSYASRGQTASLDALRKALPAESLATLLTIGGEALPVSEWLARYGTSPPPAPSPMSAEPGGGLVPLRRGGTPVDKAAWTEGIPVLSDLVRTPKKDQEDEDGWVRSDSSGGAASFRLTATIVGGNIVINLGKSLFAYRIEDGKEIWTRGGERGLSAFLGSTAARTFHGIVPAGDRVIAIEAGKEKGGVRRTDLVCLKATGGKLVWCLDDENDGKTVSFAGVPYVHEGRVYAGAVEQEESGKFHVVCVDAESGQVLWNRFVGSQPSPNSDYHFAHRPEAVFALRGRVLYVCTSMGLVAALDPTGGDLLWGLKYGGGATDENEMMRIQYGYATVQRAVSPILVAPEGLWIAPTDASRYHLLDPSTRSLRLSRRKDVGEEYRFLVGHDGGRLVLGGREIGVYSRMKGLIDHMELAATEGEARPALAEGLLLVPTSRELLGLSTPELDKAWSIPLEKGQCGDVLVAPEGIALVSLSKVSWFPWK